MSETASAVITVSKGIRKEPVLDRPREVTPEILEIARLVCTDENPEEYISILRSFTPT